jgi:hypothetical protein
VESSWREIRGIAGNRGVPTAATARLMRQIGRVSAVLTFFELTGKEKQHVYQ